MLLLLLVKSYMLITDISEGSQQTFELLGETEAFQ